MNKIADYNDIFEPADSDEFVKKTFGACNAHLSASYLRVTYGMVYMKMLKQFKDGSVLSYNDVFPRVFDTSKNKLGHDKDSFKSLFSNKFIAFDHYGKYRRPYYKITQFGKKICEIAEVNDIAYRVLRHVKLLSCNDDIFCARMVGIETNPETCSDMLSKTFVDLLEELFNEKSKMHEIGSYVHWCNTLVKGLKNCKNFYDLFVCDEVKRWLAANTDNQAVKKFSAVLDKISKIHAKAA